MANICTNIFFCSSESKNVLQQIEEYLQETFDTYHLEVDNNFLEAEFNSKWSFPMKEMEKLTTNLKEDEDLYMRCLSYEFGCDYVEYMIFEKGEWNSNIK
ncbi:MAG: hypothetical protein ACWIPI_10165 [Polaribacter sp.]